MILVRNIRLPLSAAEPQAFEKALHTLRVPRSKVEHTGVAKLSVDARHGQPHLAVAVEQVDVVGVAGLGVVGLALAQLPGYEAGELVARLALDERALRLAHHQVAVQHLGRGLEVDHGPPAVHVVDVVEEARRAAAAAQHHVFELGGLVEHGPLHLAEALLAPLREELGHRLVHPGLDVPVEVVELQAQLPGQRLAYGGLAGPHVAYDDYPGHCLRGVVALSGRCHFFFCSLFCSAASITSTHSSSVRSAARACMALGRR